MEKISFERFMQQLQFTVDLINLKQIKVTYENQDEIARMFDSEFPGFHALRTFAWGWDEYWELTNNDLLAMWLYDNIYMARGPEEDFNHWDAVDDVNFPKISDALKMFA
jgi:hypothetical protein